jgi:hypothetical protein
MNQNVLPTLTCKHCGNTLFEKVEIGQFLVKQDWLDKGLPLPKKIIDEYSQGGGAYYRCFECRALANKPTT